MDNLANPIRTNRRLKAVLAVVAALLLTAGMSWRRVAADSRESSAARSAVIATHAPRSFEGAKDSYADVVGLVAPAVVTIRTEGKARAMPTGMSPDDLLRRFFGDEPPNMRRQPEFKQRALGSGVIVTPDGYIVTNHHVIDNAEVIRVELNDSRSFEAKLVGSDKPSDIAVLKINAQDLHTLALGNSDRVRVGDVVLAVGNPLGVGETVTMGIISAKGRATGLGDGGFEDFLQTDAPINQGNSGGALVNTKGELVGINSQILSPSGGNIGIGFAIPANMARNVMDQLVKSGRVRRAQLGVTVQPVTSDLAASLGLTEPRGALVDSVEKGSAADKAGLERGDVITMFQGASVHDTNSLRNRVAEMKPGTPANVTIVRNGREQNVSVTLGELAAPRLPSQTENSAPGDKLALGVTVQPMTPELAQWLGVSPDTKGLAIMEVDPSGRAADAGIQTGDVIEEVNRQPVSSVDQLRSAVKSASDKPLLVLLNRGGKDLFVTVRRTNA